jgi:hypothetical protein
VENLISCLLLCLLLFVCLFGGVSKAGEITKLPKTSLLVAVLRVAKGRAFHEPDRVQIYVFRIHVDIPHRTSRRENDSCIWHQGDLH